jgi:hypothetical protein
MAQLSRLLDDIYSSYQPVDGSADTAAPLEADTVADPIPPLAPRPAPADADGAAIEEMSTVEALEAAFADWVPGSPDGVPAAEKAYLAEAVEQEAVAHDPMPATAFDDVYAAPPSPVIATLARPVDDEVESLPSPEDLFRSVFTPEMPAPARIEVENTFLDALDPVIAPVVPVAVEPEPIEAVEAVAPTIDLPVWRFEDDDILPQRRSRRFRLTLRK